MAALCRETFQLRVSLQRSASDRTWLCWCKGSFSESRTRRSV